MLPSKSALKMEALCFSKTLVSIYQFIWRYCTESQHGHLWQQFTRSVEKKYNNVYAMQWKVETGIDCCIHSNAAFIKNGPTQVSYAVQETSKLSIRTGKNWFDLFWCYSELVGAIRTSAQDLHCVHPK
jgi:hypothetical protein